MTVLIILGASLFAWYVVVGIFLVAAHREEKRVKAQDKR